MASSSLKDYLKKYQSAEDQHKKKKKKKSNAKPAGAGVLVVDEDPVWQKPVVIEEEDSADDEVPQVDEDIEVKRMKRLEAVRARNCGISEDGSGWISISDQPKNSNGDRDLSPPRQGRPKFDKPPGREADAEDYKYGELSPPGQRRRRLDTPLPEQRPRTMDAEGSEDGDLSPPRQRRRRLDTPSPERGPGAMDPAESKDGDLSPPRKRLRRLDTPSPEQRHGAPHLEKVDDDLSPPRRRSEMNMSLHVRRRNLSPGLDGDLSPPRKRKVPSITKNEDLSPPRKKREPSITKDTRRTGLLSALDIRKELDKKRKEEMSRFASMDPSMSGKGAEPVFRDKEGKKINKEELLKAQEEEKPKEKKLEWGKGLAQKREFEAKMKELELEKEKPFARTRDDPELDSMLKDRIRWGDPMAHLVMRKNSEPILEDLSISEKMKESGFIVPQSIPSHSWIKRGLDFPPNRYGIRPGRHWDGVDRSNGYEKELFKRQNEKRATETEAYLWSVSDM